MKLHTRPLMSSGLNRSLFVYNLLCSIGLVRYNIEAFVTAHTHGESFTTVKVEPGRLVESAEIQVLDLRHALVGIRSAANVPVRSHHLSKSPI
jgi:hypothetical protein